MSMKKILMAAVAVTALTAGSANALSIVAANTYVGAATTPTTLTPTAPTASYPYEAFTIANEYNLNSATLVPVKITASLTNPLAASTSYIVTYTVTGGTFDTPSVTDVAVQATAGAAAGTNYAAAGGVLANVSAIQQGPVNSSTAATSVAFVVPVGSATTAQAISWAAKIKPNTTKEGVSVSVNVAYLNSPTIAIEGGATLPVPVIDFRSGLTFATPTAVNATLTNASGFKKFSSAAGDVLTSTIGTGIKFSVVASDFGANDAIHKEFNAAAATNAPITTADILTAALTISGDLTVQKAILGASQAADAAANPNVITANSTNLALIQASTGTSLTLATAGTAAGIESAYSITPVITLGSNLLPLTYSAKKLGEAIYEGTTINAPWVGDGSNGINYLIRIANKSSSAAVTSVNAFLLNPFGVVAAGGTVLQTAACPMGSIAAKGELLVDSAKLAACFGD